VSKQTSKKSTEYLASIKDLMTVKKLRVEQQLTAAQKSAVNFNLSIW